jgi:hypothetical protein
MYYCPNCNNPVTYGDKFCGNCGFYFDWPTPQQQMPPPYQQGSQYSYNQPPGWGQQPPSGYQPPQPPPYQQPAYPPQGWGTYQNTQQPNYYGYGNRIPQRQGSSSGTTLLVVLIVIVMLAGAIAALTNGSFDVASLVSGKPTVASTTNPSGGTTDPGAPAQPAAPTAIKITAGELVGAYKSDKAAAAATYKDKTCTITGVVDSVSVADLSVLLTSGKPNEEGVKCVFHKTNQSVITSFETTGQTITIEGNVSDYNVDVIVTGCRIVK